MKAVKVRCTCSCHSSPEGTVKHIRACCDNGYKTVLVEGRDYSTQNRNAVIVVLVVAIVGLIVTGLIVIYKITA